MTPSGQRDALVRFERASVTTTSMGVEEEGPWSPIEQAWAKVLYGTGAERRQAASEAASATATFRVLSTSALRGVGERDRIVDRDGRAWDITGIAPIGVNAEIEFTATVAKG